MSEKGGYKNIDPHGGVKFKEGNRAAEKWTEERALAFGNEMINWMTSADENIFFDEFIFLIAPSLPDYGDVSIFTTTPAYLANKYSSFSNLLERARKIQETRLKKFGAFDKLNASIVKFLLSAEHGLSEKSIIESTNTTDINISPKTLDDWYDKNRCKKKP